MAQGEGLQPFEARLEQRDGALVVALAGEFDVAGVEPAAAAFAEALSGDSARIVLDLRGLSFMDSSGIRCLVEAKTLAEGLGVGMAVLNGSGPPHRVMELAGLDELFEAAEEPRDSTR